MMKMTKFMSITLLQRLRGNYMAMKRCTCCGEEKPRTSQYFYYQNKKWGYFRSYCIECWNKKGKEWYRDKIGGNYVYNRTTYER